MRYEVTKDKVRVGGKDRKKGDVVLAPQDVPLAKAERMVGQGILKQAVTVAKKSGGD